MNRRLFLLVIVMLAAVALPARWAAAGPGLTAEPAATSTSFIPGEPNDTFEDALPFGLGESQMGHFLSAADVDFYRIDLSAAKQLSAHITTGYGYDQTGMTAEIAVYDTAQTLLAENADCNDPATVEATVPAGTFYIRVRPCSGTLDIDKAYRLGVGWTNAPEVEPNNTRPTASTLETFDPYWLDPDPFTWGAIDPAGDIDFYRFEGQAGQWISIYTYDAVELTLQNANGADITAGQSFEIKLTGTGTYYLRVRSATHPTGTGDYLIYYSSNGHMAGDVEPNDTPAQATPIEYGQILHGGFSDTDMVDYYRFEGQAGDQIAIAPTETSGIRWANFTLYDPAMNPVTLNATDWPVEWGTLPVTGSYWLAFRDYDYYRAVYLTGGDEPNNTRATATEIPFGPTLDAHHDYPCDTDWYRFQGRAGDVLATINTAVVTENIYLYAADGTYMSGIHVLPADGVYYLHVLGFTSDKWDNYCDASPRTVAFAEALWVSAAVDGLGGNAAIRQGDIVTRKNAANQWQVVFDASDVGIIKNVVAFERMPNGSILMSLAAAQNVPGLGQVMPHDVIRFVPSSLGDNTAGTFAWYLDGSDVGLTTTGEKIDAIAMQPAYANPLRISTTGAGAVPRQSGGTLKFADEDMINFVATGYGATSAGKWRMNIDGSGVPGMAVEDITAATRVEAEGAQVSQTLLSFDSAFTIKGISGTFRDVMNEGTWLPAVRNLTDKKIDGLAIGPAWLP